MNDIPNYYTLGFVFSPTFNRVLLVEKNRGPRDVAGRLNGIGGKLQYGETPMRAMHRETLEETTIPAEICFHPRLTVLYPLQPAVVFVFSATADFELDLIETKTDEKLRVVHTHDICRLNVVRNCLWLIPLLCDPEFDHPVTIQLHG